MKAWPQICFIICSKKHVKHGKFENITDITKFKNIAECWKNRDHDFCKVYSKVDWNDKEQKMPHKSCKGKFFKESYLNVQKEKEEIAIDISSPIEKAIDNDEHGVLMSHPHRKASRKMSLSVSYAMKIATPKVNWSHFRL